jgi:hypothetical protein
VEKQRRNLIAISCKFGYSFFILIHNFELLIELKVLSSPLFFHGKGLSLFVKVKGSQSTYIASGDPHVRDNTFQTTTTSTSALQ